MNPSGATLGFLARIKRLGRSSLLRGLAGSPAGLPAPGRSRRGTVLILVIGALALISVITLIYATIGQADRRNSQVVVQKASVDSVGDQVAGYISGVIASGTFAVHVDGVSPLFGGSPILVRSGMDYPWTDPYRLSIAPPGSAALRDRAFDPTGSYDSLPTSDIDLRIPATPFLAATAPTAIAYNPTINPPWVQFKDWMHISNLAPDGRFVNLVNLRGNFDALSTMTVNLGTGQGNPQPGELSWGLCLLDDMGNPTQLLPGGGTANPNRPADWSTLQRGAFRPLLGPNFYSNFAAANQPDHEWYAPYQWADTDGDGIADARWFEMVDATDPNNPRSLLPQDGRFRWFVAARVMDLTGLVNLNTATDFRSANFATTALPGQAAPGTQITKVGMYPADVDLRRVLMGDDTSWRWNLSYAGIPQPQQSSFEDYSGYSPAAARGVGALAYDALRISLRKDNAAVPTPGSDLAAYMAAMNPPLTTYYGDDRARNYLRFGGQDTAGYSTNRNFEQSTRFGMADLLELLTYHGINDPGVTSRLEQASAGRFDTNNGGSATTAGFGPLRENRGMGVERDQIDVLENNGQGDGVLDTQAMALAATDVRRKVTTVSGGRLLRSNLIPPGLRGVLESSYDGRIDLVEALQVATGTTPSARNPSLLMEGIAQGMLPHHSRANAWDPAAFPDLKTLHYGHSAELALRHAAFLAANNIDSYDKDNTPSAFTLLINEDARAAVNANTADFQWWTETGANFPGRLDVGANRLARNANPIQAPAGAINVYGIEAQPFLTQALGMVFYTDSPDNPTEPPNSPITIRGNVSPAAAGPDNPDFLGSVLAFQITNPFDQRINLSRIPSASSNRQPIASNNWTEFYIQYGSNLIMLAEWRASTTGGEPTLEEIWLDPHETRVVYCLSHPQDYRYGPSSMEERFRDADPGLPPQPATFIDEVLKNQLTVMVGSSPKPPILVPVMRKGPAAGEFQPLPQDTPIDLFANATDTERMNVYLWRNLHSRFDPVGVTSGTSATNNRNNDMLADRLRDPAPPGGARQAPTLDRRMSAGDKDINNTIAPLDDTGYSIVLWGTIRRNDDPGLPPSAPPAAPNIPLGAIPAYCLEGKWIASTGSTRLLQNTKDAKPSTLNSLSKSDFSSAAEPSIGDDTLSGLVTKLKSATGVLIQTKITKAPEDRSGDSIDKANPVGGLPGNRDGRLYNTLYPQIALDNENHVSGTGPAALSTMRVTDVLLPLGIGPCYEPPLRGGALPATYVAPDPERCMALSEALALALNYSAPEASNPIFGIFANLGDPLVGSVDRGNLVLDNFVPYEDQVTPGVYTQPSITTGAGGDPTRYPGIPLALNLLNVFRTLDPQFAGMTKAAPGLININTAPVDVVRALPLLSPTTEPTVWQNWLLQAGLTAGITAPVQPTAPGAADGTDIAAAVIAGRDKLLFPDRSANGFVNFSDFAPTKGRRLTTQIDALREAPGFGSVAELMTLTRRRAVGDPPLVPNPVSPRFPIANRIDYLRGDGAPSGATGINTSLYRDPPLNSTSPNSKPTKIDTIPDDYSEKLAVAGAVMNSVSVRSDVFAVWFVIHGYQRSDTEGLRPEDPLTPTIAKRFVMVVDRSNVTRMGQKPKILLFTEVPL